MRKHKLILTISLTLLAVAFLTGCSKSDKEPLPVGEYDAGSYTIVIPDTYEDKSFAEYENGRLDIYDMKTYETSGGLLVSIVEYRDDSYKEHVVERENKVENYYDVLGEKKGVKYVAIYPIQAQYNITNTIEYYRYTKLISKVDDIVKSFELK